MPKLLTFVPCERVILSQEDNSVSLISILTEVQASLPFPDPTTIPENASVPLRWYFFSMWWFEPGDEGRKFTQRTTLESENGKILVSGEVAVEMLPEKKSMRCVVSMPAFPVSRPGTCVARLSIRPTDRTTEQWVEMAWFPVVLTLGPTLDFEKTSEDLAKAPGSSR
jgi:hypothetical protein